MKRVPLFVMCCTSAPRPGVEALGCVLASALLLELASDGLGLWDYRDGSVPLALPLLEALVWVSAGALAPKLAPKRALAARLALTFTLSSLVNILASLLEYWHYASSPIALLAGLSNVASGLLGAGLARLVRARPGERAWRPWARVLAPVLLGLPLGGAICEGVLALRDAPLQFPAWHERNFTYLLDDDLDWTLEPFAYHNCRIDSNGFRGPEVKEEKAPGTIRIAIVGGSAAFDIYASDADAWTRQLEQNLREKTGKSIEVLNAACPGYSSWQTLKLARKKLERWHPDWVVHYEQGNDSLTFGRPDIEAVKARGWKLCARANAVTWLAHDSLLLRALARALPRTTDRLRVAAIAARGRVVRRWNDAFWKGPLTREVEPAALDFLEENLRGIAQVSQRLGARFVLVTQASLLHQETPPELLARVDGSRRGLTPEKLFQACERARAIEKKVAAETRGALFIDAHAALPPSLELFRDEAHLTPQGSARLASVIAEGLLPELK